MKNSCYKTFNDERRFRPAGLLHPSRISDRIREEILSKVERRKYKLNNEIEIFFDGESDRVRTNIPDVYLQIFRSSNFGDIEKRIFVSIAGRRVQFSRRNNKTLQPSEKKMGEGGVSEVIWKIEEIGSPLNVFTGHEDERRGLFRPKEERRQCLTNGCSFKTQQDLDLAIDLVSGSFALIGDIFSADAAYGRDSGANHRAVFSKELIKEIQDGDYADI